MKKETGFESDVKQAISSTEVPKIYSNGFIVFRSNSDTGIVLQHNGQPAGVVSMSFTTAKSLMIKLGDVIREFEELVETEILTIDEINRKTKREANDDKIIK